MHSKGKIRFIICAVIIFTIVLSNIGKFVVFASTIDDVRELIGGYRLEDKYSSDEIEDMLTEYFKVKKHNNVVDIIKIIEKINLEGDDERVKLDTRIRGKKDELYDKFRSGESIDSILEVQVELNVLLMERENLRKESKLDVGYIDDTWMTDNSEVSILLQQLEANFDIGDLGTSLKSPVLSSFIITSPYGVRRDPFGDGFVMHYGLDLRARNGEPILSQWNGVVEGVYETELGGKTIVVNHGVGLKTRYLHLSEIYVVEGQNVKQYQIIGASGDTGRVTGEHLHFEVYVDGVITNPIYFYGQRGINALRVFISDNRDYDNWNRNVLIAIKDASNANYEHVVENIGVKDIIGDRRFDIGKDGEIIFYDEECVKGYKPSESLDLLNELVK